MKRRYSRLALMLLILAAMVTIARLYTLKHEGSYCWSRHVHPFFDEQSSHVMGYGVTSYWAVSWGQGRVTLQKEYLAEMDDLGYQAPPGFPMDDYLEGEYKRNWSQSIDQEEQALNHHGFGSAMTDACNENTWWGRRGFGKENSVKLPPYTIRAWMSGMYANGVGRVAYTIPLWAIIFPLLILPAFKLRTLVRRRRRIAAGKCMRCGYDLRASPGRCPECGLDGVSQSVTLA